MHNTRMPLALSLALSFVLYLASFPLRADYQLGLDAYQSGDYARALSEWMKVAASAPGQVNPAILAETQYAIGMLYWMGQGVQQDTVASAHWLRQAAELNHPGAQAKLGYLYTIGQGVPQNDFEALKWLRMAASQGDADAQYNLGVMYRDGRGVAKDPGLALQWFRKAADNGDPVSAGIVAGYERADSGKQPGPVVMEQPAAHPVADKARSVDLAPSGETQSAPEPGLNEDWIRRRDPEHYTIQVIALLQPDKLYDFIRRHSDWSPLAIYHQQWQGKPLWVLVQGDYADVAQARKAVRKFPRGLQERENMWIRRFAMVQALIQ